MVQISPRSAKSKSWMHLLKGLPSTPWRRRFKDVTTSRQLPPISILETSDTKVNNAATSTRITNLPTTAPNSKIWGHFSSLWIRKNQTSLPGISWPQREAQYRDDCHRFRTLLRQSRVCSILWSTSPIPCWISQGVPPQLSSKQGPHSKKPTNYATQIHIPKQTRANMMGLLSSLILQT